MINFGLREGLKVKSEERLAHKKSLDIFYNLLPNIDEKENWLFIYELYKNDKIKFLAIKSIYSYSKFYEYLEDNNITFISKELLYEKLEAVESPFKKNK